MHSFDTLFLDRDGVINKKLEGRYVRDFSEFEFMEGTIDAISKLTNKFNRIIIITNQQGIGKGIMSDADLNILHTKMEERIEQLGGKINKIYYCPHLEELDCLCRKPRPGMIEDYNLKKIEMGGCVIEENAPNRHCNECEQQWEKTDNYNG